MKLVLVSIVLCAAIYAASAMNMIASSSRALNRREANLVRRLAKRQAYSDPNCDPRRCAIPNCGKDTIAGTLPGECCERCIPWEYAQAIGLHPRGPQLVQDPRPQQHQPAQDTYNQHSQPQRVDVYIFGPDDGARVSAGQSIYFDCEVVSPYNQNAQPRWSRSGNQPLPYKAQSTILPGNRKIARLTVPDATQADAGRYECSAGTGNSNDQASIDLQVTDGRYYVPPQPQPQPQPQYPQNDPRYQHQYNQPGYYPPQPQPQPQPQPEPQPQPQPHYQPDNQDAGDEEENEEPAAETTTAAKPVYPPAAGEEHADGGAEDTEYPEDYTENEK